MSSNLEPILEALGEVTEQRKLLEQKEKELKAELATFLAEKGDSTFTAGSYVFTQKVMKGRRTLDTDALTEAGFDLEPYYKVGKPYTTLSIKRLS